VRMQPAEPCHAVLITAGHVSIVPEGRAGPRHAGNRCADGDIARALSGGG
jgi:hypothetical protein